MKNAQCSKGFIKFTRTCTNPIPKMAAFEPTLHRPDTFSPLPNFRLVLPASSPCFLRFPFMRTDFSRTFYSSLCALCKNPCGHGRDRLSERSFKTSFFDEGDCCEDEYPKLFSNASFQLCAGRRRRFFEKWPPAIASDNPKKAR